MIQRTIDLVLMLSFRFDLSFIIIWYYLRNKIQCNGVGCLMEKVLDKNYYFSSNTFHRTKLFIFLKFNFSNAYVLDGWFIINKLTTQIKYLFLKKSRFGLAVAPWFSFIFKLWVSFFISDHSDQISQLSTIWNNSDFKLSRWVPLKKYKK